jgi:arylsulfatase A-like enzyme
LKKILLIVLGLVVLAGVGFWLKYGSGPTPDDAFGKTTTPNLASMIKQRPADAPAPNVIILLADDLGWGDVGYHGSDIQTPNIDKIAAEGMALEKFYSNPICTPTRSALMTGRDPIRLGLAHAVLMAWQDGGVSLDEHFMPESFVDAGYDTAMVGKWHLGHTIEQHLPNARGFNQFYGHVNTQVSYFDHEFAQGHDFQQNGETVSHEGEYATDVHGDQSVKFLTETRDKSKPFLLYVPFLAPHSPMEAKEEDLAKYPNRIDIPGDDHRTYAAMVDSMDQQIGKILDALEAEGEADNTIVLFFSDNGGSTTFGSRNAPLRGGKLEAFEGGIRVPAAIRWPDVLPAGTVNDAVISVMDLFPTLMTATGLTSGAEKEMDGVDRWAAITGNGPEWRGDPLIFTSNIPEYNNFQYGVLDGRWKLIQTVNHLRRETEVETLLFDLSKDPYEATDIAAQNPEQVERLTAILDARLAEHPVGGTFVQISPHPGWRAPKDYAQAVLPAELINETPHAGFGALASRVLQSRYDDKGKIIYE